MKILQYSPIVGSSADVSHSVQSSKQFNMQQMPGSATVAETPSSESLPFQKVDKPNKRKTVTSGRLSWSKEIMQGPQSFKTLGEAEVDWARATNRFSEKVEFETSLEDGLPLRSKRRLLYTTQLVQQLFRPPPAKAISLLASSNYESVAYTAARAALGDACSSTCTDMSEPQSNSNPLETKTTIADLRVEVEDLEKFAMINRFSRFHPSSSSSMQRNVSPLRLNAQRYVTIAPMPQNMPDRAQCLSPSN